MGRICGSSCKTISRKCAMAVVIVEAMCVLPKTEPGQSPIHRPIPCCDDVVQYIDTEAKYVIAVDMDSGYW